MLYQDFVLKAVKGKPHCFPIEGHFMLNGFPSQRTINLKTCNNIFQNSKFSSGHNLQLIKFHSLPSLLQTSPGRNDEILRNILGLYIESRREMRENFEKYKSETN
jgi:hypothetical protein